jgi:hypothetical protein
MHIMQVEFAEPFQIASLNQLLEYMIYDLISIKAKNNVQKEYNVLPQSSG